MGDKKYYTSVWMENVGKKKDVKPKIPVASHIFPPNGHISKTEEWNLTRTKRHFPPPFCYRYPFLIGLQRLAANEVGPPADLGRNTLLAGQLLAHALSKENGSLKSCS
jgi:hypothetical protein